jgi:hypothetical protein
MSPRHSLRAFLCGIGGHELMRSFEPNRVYMRCTSCPYETQGWTLKEKPHQAAAPRAAFDAAFVAQSMR